MSTIFKATYLFVISLIGIFLVSCGDSPTAARVGNHVITIDDVVKAASDGNRARPPFSYGVLMEKVNELIENELAAIDARRIGYDRNQAIIDKTSNYRDGQVYSQVINDLVIKKVIPDKMIKEKYRSSLYEHHVRHIFFTQKGGKISPEDSTQIIELRRQLMRNGDFDDLARQFSQDSLSAGKGGDMGFIKWGDRNWGDPFYQAVSRLKRGQVSKVIRSDKGLHLIKLEELRQVKQPSFEAQKDELRRSFYRSMNRTLDSTFNDLVAQMEKRYKANYPEGAADSLLSFFLAAPQMGINVQREPLTLLDSLSADQRSLVLAKYAGGAFTVEDALHKYEGISPRRRPNLNNPKEIQTFISRNVPRLLIIRYGYQKGYHRKAAVRQAVAEENKRLMAEQVRGERVIDHLDASAEELKTFFEGNRHLFESGAQMDVQQIFVKDEALAYDIFDRAIGGEDFTELAQQFNERSETQESDGRLGWISDQTKGGIAVTASKMTPGEISKPFRLADGFAVIKVLARQDGEPADFKKSENKARREFRAKRREQLQREWMNTVRETVPIVINKAVIKKEAGLER